MTWHPLPHAPGLAAVIKECRQDFAGMVLTSAFGGGIDRQPMAGLFRNLHRLTIRAAEEYEAALAEHTLAVESAAPNILIIASSHWEGCVEAVHRAINMAEAIRGGLPRWAPAQDELRIARPAQFRDGERNRIRGFRDACQHLDTELPAYDPEDNHDPSGRGLFVMPLEDRISFHGHVLYYGELAGLIKRLAAICHWLHMQEIPAGHPLAHPERTSSVRIKDNEPFLRPFDLDLVS